MAVKKALRGPLLAFDPLAIGAAPQTLEAARRTRPSNAPAPQPG
ncbi:hypothetical protein AG0111_0g5046 [Alternaria gaisen]|uniref:Uncharacterized protein n=1 Tax=Alternaria gaisen TaxID=167740 RepID=A0ACB6FQU8_9PLEO|nr:hypothetical protein AG0111_0g5046 [Alternaria gaisen]